MEIVIENVAILPNVPKNYTYTVRVQFIKIRKMSVIQSSRLTKLNAEKTFLYGSVSWRLRTRRIIHFITAEMARKTIKEGKFGLVTMLRGGEKGKYMRKKRNQIQRRKRAWM